MLAQLAANALLHYSAVNRYSGAQWQAHMQRPSAALRAPKAVGVADLSSAPALQCVGLARAAQAERAAVVPQVTPRRAVVEDALFLAMARVAARGTAHRRALILSIVHSVPMC